MSRKLGKFFPLQGVALNCKPVKTRSVVIDTSALFTMTSASSGSSRFLAVCCCVTFVSVFIYTVGFIRLELELRAHRERIAALEQTDREPNKQNVTEKASLNKGKPWRFLSFLSLTVRHVYPKAFNSSFSAKGTQMCVTVRTVQK